MSCDTPAEVGGLELLDETVYHSITPSGMPPHELRLKKGCLVILLRNLNVTEGLCNGTRLRVDNMSERVCLGCVAFFFSVAHLHTVDGGSRSDGAPSTDQHDSSR